MPAALPAMSHSATSMALSAALAVEPMKWVARDTAWW